MAHAIWDLLALLDNVLLLTIMWFTSCQLISWHSGCPPYLTKLWQYNNSCKASQMPSILHSIIDPLSTTSQETFLNAVPHNSTVVPCSRFASTEQSVKAAKVEQHKFNWIIYSYGSSSFWKGPYMLASVGLVHLMVSREGA